MKIKETEEYEVYSLWDIPSVMLATIKILIEKKDTKNYIIIIIRKR